MISTFPSLKIEIDNYPAVKSFLKGFKPKIKQKGEALTVQEIKSVIAHGKKFGIEMNANTLKKSRKKTNNKWFETQDSIDYWEDFNRQKIAWNRIASEKQYSLIDEGIYIQDSMHFITGKKLEYLCAILNSSLFSWLMNLIVGKAAGGNAGNSDNIRDLYVFKPEMNLEIEIIDLLNSKQYKCIDEIIFKAYQLNEDEVITIESQ